MTQRITKTPSDVSLQTCRPKTRRRKPRADAQRNRERILEVAKLAFTRSGADTNLDDNRRPPPVATFFQKMTQRMPQE